MTVNNTISQIQKSNSATLNASSANSQVTGHVTAEKKSMSKTLRQLLQKHSKSRLKLKKNKIPCLERDLLRSKPLTCLKRHSKKKRALIFPRGRTMMGIIRLRLRRLNKNRNRTGKRAKNFKMPIVMQQRGIRLVKRRSAKTTTSI